MKLSESESYSLLINGTTIFSKIENVTKIIDIFIALQTNKIIKMISNNLK